MNRVFNLGRKQRNNEEEAHLLTTSMEPGELPDPARRGRDGKEVVDSKGFDRGRSTCPRAGLSLSEKQGVFAMGE